MSVLHKVLVIISAICFTLPYAEAQTIKKTADGYVVRPDELGKYPKRSYLENIYAGRINLNELTYKGDIRWVVYSERDNNITFSDPNYSREKDKLVYAERLFVKDISDDGKWLHLENPEVLIDGKMQSVDKGWIEVKYLLINIKAATTDLGHTVKVMTLISLEQPADTIFANDMKQYITYSSPSLEKRYEKQEEPPFKIFYVLKEVTNGFLISLSDVLVTAEGYADENTIIGWLPKKQAVPWDHRICLEPSNSNRAKEQYPYGIPVFFNEIDFNNYLGGAKMEAVKIKPRIIRLTGKRPDMYQMRMPILEQELNGESYQKKVVSILSLSNRDSGNGASDELKKRLEFYKKRRSINILFVLDATESMDNYFVEIAESISELLDELKEKKSKAKIKVGYILYRDYADGEDADYLRPLTPNYEQIKDELVSEPRESKGTSRYEAMYNAIVKNIDQVGYKEDESNMMVLIGDCGNFKNDKYDLSDISKAIEKYQINLIGYQAFQKDEKDGEYSAFRFQLNEMITSIALSVKKEYNNSYQPNIQNDKNFENTKRLTFKSEGTDKTDVVNRFGIFTYATGKMDPRELKENIKSNIEVYIKNNEDGIKDIEKSIREARGGKIKLKGEKLDTNDILPYARYLCELDDNCNWSNQYDREAKIEFILSLNEFSYDSYTLLRAPGTSIDGFKPVVYISKGELQEAVDNVKQLNVAGNDIEEREKLYAAIVSITEAQLGEKNIEELISEMTLTEIWKIILNIPFDENGEFGDLKDRKLKEIKNKNVNIDTFLRSFKRNVKDFTMENMNDSKFQIMDDDHYWIPLERFPGQ